MGAAGGSKRLMDMDVIAQAIPRIISAVPATLSLAAISLSVGFLAAVPLALVRLSKHATGRQAADFYVYIVRSTPLLVQLFLIYYGAGQFRPFLESIHLWSFFREPWFCAILALALHNAAYTSEILRGGIQSVPVGQVEAARACGMRRSLLFRRIVFPIAFRHALPAYSNEVVLIVKGTALASTVTIIEITGAAQQVIATTYSPVSVFAVAGAIYLSINFCIIRCLQLLEIRLSPDLKSRSRELIRAKRTLFGFWKTTES